jgi:hypothetical protein
LRGFVALDVSKTSVAIINSPDTATTDVVEN